MRSGLSLRAQRSDHVRASADEHGDDVVENDELSALQLLAREGIGAASNRDLQRLMASTNCLTMCSLPSLSSSIAIVYKKPILALSPLDRGQEY